MQRSLNSIDLLTAGVDAPHNWPISYKETETADEEEFADVVGA